MDELTPTPKQRRALSAYEKICAEACLQGCGKSLPRVIDDAEAHEPKWINWHYKVIDLRCNYIVPCKAPAKDDVISGLVREVERLKADLEDITKWIGKDTDHFDYLWSAIVNQPDSVLTGDAIEAKRRMLEISGVERYQKAIEAAQKLLDAMETCHVCTGTLLVDEGPPHCEDRSGDCDSHDEPDCPSLYALHLNAKNALKGIS